jgi:hypothetical protein
VSFFIALLNESLYSASSTLSSGKGVPLRQRCHVDRLGPEDA